MIKFIPLVLVLIAVVFGVSYVHESDVTSEVKDEVQSSLAAPEHKSEIPL
ncbi:MAG: hypothetical protein V4598_07440 [Bdellovibrionota bacterium]